MGLFSDLKGTLQSYFKIGLSGVYLKSSSGNLIVRNPADTANAEVTASKVNISGTAVELNSDASESGNDFSYKLQIPSGMTYPIVLTLPASFGEPGQILGTDGAGNLIFSDSTVNAYSDIGNLKVHTATLQFSSSPDSAIFDLPAGAVVDRVELILDQPFNGTPSMSVGNIYDSNVYMAGRMVNLSGSVGDRYQSSPSEPPVSVPKTVHIIYADGGATVGSARVLIYYSVPVVNIIQSEPPGS